jgi:riboflavin kinase, archaea type
VPQLVFEGKVVSGKRAGKKFLELPWVRRQIQEKLDFIPYAGTLNLQLSKEEEVKRKQLEENKGIIIEPKPGYYPGALFRAKIDDVVCAVVLPCIPKYPSSVLEVISPVYLRGKFGLEDGCVVSLTAIF